MGLDTKTYWLTDRQSQCDFDFDSLVSVVELVRWIEVNWLVSELLSWESDSWKPFSSARELQW
jgi:hypothetical protein